MPVGFPIEIIENLKKIKENSRIWTAGRPEILPKSPKFFENLRKFPQILGWAGSGLGFPRFPEPSWLGPAEPTGNWQKLSGRSRSVPKP